MTCAPPPGTENGSWHWLRFDEDDPHLRGYGVWPYVWNDGHYASVIDPWTEQMAYRPDDPWFSGTTYVAPLTLPDEVARLRAEVERLTAEVARLEVAYADGN